MARETAVTLHYYYYWRHHYHWYYYLLPSTSIITITIKVDSKNTISSYVRVFPSAAAFSLGWPLRNFRGPQAGQQRRSGRWDGASPRLNLISS